MASVTLWGGSSLTGGALGKQLFRCNVARVTSAWEMNLDQVEDRPLTEREVSQVSHLGLSEADGRPRDQLPECPWAGRLTSVESGGEVGLHGCLEGQAVT